MNNNDKTVIGKLLDDLMHLEIDTIIKKGMTSALQPEEIGDVLRVLLNDYSERLEIIVRRNDVTGNFKIENIVSYRKLYIAIKWLTRIMDRKEIRINENDYIILMRMKAFCKYLESRTDIKGKIKNGLTIDTIKLGKNRQPTTAYSLNMIHVDKYDMLINERDKVRFRRLYDLGTERIVLQTRFGIDGDVVTRIEEEFASKPHQVVLKLHEEHTNLSLKYWQSLVNIVVEFIKQIGKSR